MVPRSSGILYLVESLVPVQRGDPGAILVGVSGFGSARLEGSRWTDTASLTGRTTYYLRYDAQEFPWKESEHVGFVDLASSVRFLRRLWDAARVGARVASEHLRSWILRWCRAGQRVMLVGFSLGAQVVCDAVRRLPKELAHLVDVVLVCGAVADTDEQWKDLEGVSTLVNVWSSSDAVLRWLYPAAVGSGETPAAGLGPLRCRWSRSLDLTDLVGSDHLWAGRNLPRILRIVLGTEWSDLDLPSVAGELDACAVERLCGWTLAVPELWSGLGAALSGDLSQASFLVGSDRWSTEVGDRLPTLLNAGSSAARLASGIRRQDVADRGRLQLEGLTRRWMARGRCPTRPTGRAENPPSDLEVRPPAVPEPPTEELPEPRPRSEDGERRTRPRTGIGTSSPSVASSSGRDRAPTGS